MIHAGDDCRRIIPADAGSTTPFLDMSVCDEDHPRGCGEHALILMKLMNLKGSSPRMREHLFPVLP